MDLMQKRYKVIADYPGMEYYFMQKKGDILTDDGKTAVINQDGNPVRVVVFSAYPAIYKELMWWEERREEEMPDYIRLSGYIDSFNNPVPDMLFKVGKHFTYDSRNWRAYSKSSFEVAHCPGHSLEYGAGIPATIEEYEQYLNTFKAAEQKGGENE